eukprot:6172127-Prymnesium_polylepis.1
MPLHTAVHTVHSDSQRVTSPGLSPLQVYVTIATPLEVAYIPISGEMDAIFWINRSTDVIFTIEVVLQVSATHVCEVGQRSVSPHRPACSSSSCINPTAARSATASGSSSRS